MTADIIVTKDKELVRHLIFDGIEEDFDKVNQIFKETKLLYPGYAGLGKFLMVQYGGKGVFEKEAEEVFQKLDKLLGSEETNHVSIVLQQLFDYMGARVIKEDRWNKLHDNNGDKQKK